MRRFQRLVIRMAGLLLDTPETQAPLLEGGVRECPAGLSLAWLDPQHDINGQSEHRHFGQTFDPKTGLLKGLTDIDRPAIHVLGELVVHPFIEPARQTALLLLGHRHDTDAAARPQRSSTLAQHDRDFRRVEQFEGEADKDRIEEVVSKREARGIAASQLHVACQACAIQPGLGDAEHPARQIQAINLAGVAGCLRQSRQALPRPEADLEHDLARSHIQLA